MQVLHRPEEDEQREGHSSCLRPLLGFRLPVLRVHLAFQFLRPSDFGFPDDLRQSALCGLRRLATQKGGGYTRNPPPDLLHRQMDSSGGHRRHLRLQSRNEVRPDSVVSYFSRTIPVPFAVKQIHLPRLYASECAGMRVGVEGAAKSLHLPRLHAIQVTPAGVSVEGDFV